MPGKSLLISLSLFVLISTAWTQKRPIEFTDLFSMGRVADPQISPGGKWIAYTVTSYSIEDNSKNADIYLVSADGKEQRRLIEHPKTDTNPRWSPTDAKTLGFISKRDGSAQVYVVDVSGGEARKVTNIVTEVKEFAWSPDGKYHGYASGG
jgi:Tol biopolymer transport system component